MGAALAKRARSRGVQDGGAIELSLAMAVPSVYGTVRVLYPFPCVSGEFRVRAKVPRRAGVRAPGEDTEHMSDTESVHCALLAHCRVDHFESPEICCIFGKTERSHISFYIYHLFCGESERG